MLVSARSSFARWLWFILIPVLLLQGGGCVSRRISRELIHVDAAKDLHPRNKYIKVHLTNGEVYVLYDWIVNATGKVILGYGSHLDVNRRVLEQRGEHMVNKGTGTKMQRFLIHYDNIVIIETNDTGSNPGIAAMGVATLMTVPTALICIVNPKSCFGSCPTFYLRSGGAEKLVAEGFSSSISRSLQERDIDHLNAAAGEGEPVRIAVKNEALETHLIDRVRLMKVAGQNGDKVFATADGRFYSVSALSAPNKAISSGRSVLDELRKHDDLEWYSLADSFNLAAREEIDLEFPNPGGQSAIVVEMRQSLITTFLFYHAMALTGHATSYYHTRMETSSPALRRRLLRMYEILGGIEVMAKDGNGAWVKAETLREAGPIASDAHLVILPETDAPILHVRLRMARGLWRINTVNAGRLGPEVFPEYFQAKVFRDTQEDTVAARKLAYSGDYLVTWPGDVYDLVFPHAADARSSYFIESEGYYIEWMRTEWLQDQHLRQARNVLLFPRSYLRKMAPHYKNAEPEMEKTFWNSRYTRIE